MRKLLFLLVLALCGQQLQAQDLIITQAGDTINAKINRVAKDRIYFTFVHKDEVRKTLLMKHQIKQYQHNYFSSSEIPAGAVVEDAVEFPRIRLAASGGWSYRTASLPDGIDPGLEDYLKKLKSGYHLSGEAAYYFSEQMGVGVKYSTSRASNEADIYTTDPNGNTVYGKLKNDINIQFIGPYFSSRMLNQNKLNAFLLNVGLGYLGYTDKGLMMDPISSKGSTLGFSFDVGYDMRISKKMSVGVQLAMVSGSLSEMEVTRGGITQTMQFDAEQRENLSRIDLSIGLRFNQ